jgi:EthD domain
VGLKLFTFVRRAAGVSPEEFHEQWRNWHRRYLAGTPELRRHVVGCQLDHRLQEDYRRSPSRGEIADAGFDGVEILWLDSLGDLESLYTEPAWVEGLGDASFRDRDADLSCVTHDSEVIVHSERRADAQVKLVCILRRSAALNLAAFHDHWRHHHASLFQNVPELNELVSEYDQNHGLAVPGAEFDGVTEQWFASLDTFVEMVATPAHRTQVEPDVAYLLDPASIHFVLAGRPTIVLRAEA